MEKLLKRSLLRGSDGGNELAAQLMHIVGEGADLSCVAQCLRVAQEKLVSKQQMNATEPAQILPPSKVSGRFTGVSKGHFANVCYTHGVKSDRTSSVPASMKYLCKFSLCDAGLHDTRSLAMDLPSPLLRRTSFSHGESPIEAIVSKHPHVELIDDCKGSTVYALNQNLAIVRHADRLDRTPDWDESPHRLTWPNDTPLSQAGHEHATEAGKQIKKSGKTFDLIISSPYLRCAQTACRIAQVLKCPIQFDLDFGEVFDRHSLVGKIDGPQHRSPAELKALLQEDFADVVWMQDQDHNIKIEGRQQKFPESLDAARMRYCFKVRQSLQLAASKLMSILIVTHGDALGCVLGMMRKDWTIKSVPYASFAVGSRQVVVLEKGTAEIKSDEPVFGQVWDLDVSEGIGVQEVHKFSRKRQLAQREYQLRQIKANPGELETPYWDRIASFMKVLNELGANPMDTDDLVRSAGRSLAFEDYSNRQETPHVQQAAVRAGHRMLFRHKSS